MIITVKGMGFQKKFNVPAECSIAELKKKMEDTSLNTFYVKGEVVASDKKLKDGDIVTAVTKKQQIKLG